jgi:hypothetical protein
MEKDAKGKLVKAEADVDRLKKRWKLAEKNVAAREKELRAELEG